MTNRRHVAFGLVGTAFLPTVATAADYSWLEGGREVVITAQVGHGDLDLEKPKHVNLLHERVLAAAVRLCTEDDAPPLKITLETRRCIRTAMRTALPQIEEARRKNVARVAERRAD